VNRDSADTVEAMSATPPKTVRGAFRRAKRIFSRLKRKPGNLLVRIGGRLGATTVVHRVESFPAGYHRWLGRRTMKLRASFPDAWRPSLAAMQTKARVLVLVHVSAVDRLDALLTRLETFPVPVDLVVTHDAEVHVEVAPAGSIASAMVLPAISSGGEGLALASVVNAGLVDPYSLVLKLWLRQTPDPAAIDLLAADTGVVRAILSSFAADPDLGLIEATVPHDSATPNRRVVSDLLLRLQLVSRNRSIPAPVSPDFWARGFLLQGLRALDLSAEDYLGGGARPSNSTTSAMRVILAAVAAEAGYSRSSVPNEKLESTGAGWETFAPDARPDRRARVLPFYLPQFHVVEENDRWWGKGFTEWANVAAAMPMYAGHNQPLLPGEFGFYDLKDPSVTAAQHSLGAQMGVSGFMYYYYWFAGQKLLNRPIEDLVASDAPASFCIMWANENWTRRWDGSDENVLIGQDYERVPTEQFIHDVMPLLLDPRYVRVDGKPLVAIYRVTQIPDYARVFERWQVVAQENGLPGLQLVTVDVGARMQGLDDVDPREHGLDGILEFAPHNMKWEAQSLDGLEVDRRFNGRISSYAVTARDAIASLARGIDRHRYPGLMVNFDNTARRQWHPDTWYGTNPYTFRRWLRASVAAVSDRAPDERLVFINAWNEWAEGAVLEPSQRYGRTYLLAVRDVVFG